VVWYSICAASSKRYSEVLSLMDLEINHVDDRGGVYTMYLISYISLIPLFMVPSWAEITSFAIILLVMLSTYINSDLIFYNPMFVALGYKLYLVELSDGDRVYILSKQSLRGNRGIEAYLLTDYFFLVEDR